MNHSMTKLKKFDVANQLTDDVIMADCRHVPRYATLTASLNDLPAVNLTVFVAGMVMVSPVEGLRPVRSARAPVETIESRSAAPCRHA